VPYVDKVKSVKTEGFPNWGERYGAKYENWVAYLFSILCQSKNCGHRIHVLFMMYDVYWYCQRKKNEWLWTFWNRNDLYENFEKGEVVEKSGEEETKSMPHAPVLLAKSIPCELLSFRTDLSKSQSTKMYIKIFNNIAIFISKDSYVSVENWQCFFQELPMFINDKGCIQYRHTVTINCGLWINEEEINKG
jgi:hypothetical protein